MVGSAASDLRPGVPGAARTDPMNIQHTGRKGNHKVAYHRGVLYVGGCLSFVDED